MAISNAAANALGHATSGAIGTGLSTAALYPLDLVTTRLKAQRQLNASKGRDRDHESQDGPQRYDGVIDAFRTIIREEGGLSALYSGIGPDVAKSLVDSFLFFGFYSYLRRNVRHPSILQELAIGGLAGAGAKFVTTPVSNVVTRRQMSAETEQTLWATLADLHKQSGIVGLWSGYSATLILTLNPSLTFFINRRLAARIIPALEDEDVPVAWIAFFLAAGSKVAATATTYPFQTGKTRLQMKNGEDGDQTKLDGREKQQDEARMSVVQWILKFLDKSIFGVILRIAQKQGVKTLYDGLQGELLKTFFSHGLTMLTKGFIHRLVVRLWLLSLPHLRAKRLRVGGS